ncbi:MAG: hypothetical protein MJA82_18315 [Clostridia bacterium]|nr:hypothetical protein [Clostridia bacterium]
MKSCVKLTTDAVEKICGFKLKPGINQLKNNIKKNTCEMQYDYQVVVPMNQKGNKELCFLLEDSIEVAGRGSLKYGNEIKYEVLEQFRRNEFIEEPIEEGKDRPILIGYDEELQATYVEIYFMEMKNIHNLNTEKNDYYEIKISDNSNFYMYNDGRSAKKTFFYNGYKWLDDYLYNLYKKDKNLAPVEWLNNLYCHRRYISYISKKNVKKLVFDSYIWEVVCKYHEIEKLDVTLKKYGTKNYFIISDCRLFNISRVTVDCNEDIYIYNNHIYNHCTLNVSYYTGDEFTSLFKTNIRSFTEIEGFGDYSLIEIDGIKKVIVPITGLSHFKSGENSEVVVANNKIHIVVGGYEEIGFIVGDKGRLNEGVIFIGPRPDYRDISFYETYGQLKKDIHLYRTSNFPKSESIQIEIYDKRFNTRNIIEAGDSVEVLVEKTCKSKIKGLKGKVISCSKNREFLEVEFFNFFTVEFRMDEVRAV